MSEFSELIKNFNKIRDYMRDFYIYGFKSRNEFRTKSARTYDNEKRRCESYLGSCMKWSYSGGNKTSFVSVDCGKVPVNPLYSSWKSKSFTANDIMLHFYLLDILSGGEMPLDSLTNEVCSRSGVIFDLQTVRTKCNEYVSCGIFEKHKKGKGFRYKLTAQKISLDAEIMDAIKFFQGGTLGIIGSYIMDLESQTNDVFVFKHNYIAHTLDDGILCGLLSAINSSRKIRLVRQGNKDEVSVSETVYPIKIVASAHTGRRYLCSYAKTGRFKTHRLDSIKSVELLEHTDDISPLEKMLEKNMDRLWGVSFDGNSRNEFFRLKLYIDEEKEQHIINRIEKEGRGGKLERIEKNVFEFSKEVFDANEAMPWIKTFIGRIISFESTKLLEEKLKKDIRSMAKMYGVEGDV